MMPGHENPPTRSERVYRALLKVCPGEFREEYGAQMVQVFGDLCRQERRRGGVWGLVELWVRALLDLVVTAASAERSVVTKRSPGLAVLMSLLLPGLGQVYNHQVNKGLPWVLASVVYLVSVASLGHLGVGDGAAGLVLTAAVFILLPAQIWSIFDAYEVAKRTGASAGGLRSL